MHYRRRLLGLINLLDPLDLNALLDLLDQLAALDLQQYSLLECEIYFRQPRGCAGKCNLNGFYKIRCFESILPVTGPCVLKDCNNHGQFS